MTTQQNRATIKGFLGTVTRNTGGRGSDLIEWETREELLADGQTLTDVQDALEINERTDLTAVGEIDAAVMLEEAEVRVTRIKRTEDAVILHLVVEDEPV